MGSRRTMEPARDGPMKERPALTESPTPAPVGYTGGRNFPEAGESKAGMEAVRLFAIAEFGNTCTFVSQFDVPPETPMFVGDVDPGDDVHASLQGAGSRLERYGWGIGVYGAQGPARCKRPQKVAGTDTLRRYNRPRTKQPQPLIAHGVV
jgi:hypothetical protein